MSGLTEYMVGRMRVEIAQAAADDLLNAVGRLPEGPTRDEAEKCIRKARSLVADTARASTEAETFGWIVTVKTAQRTMHVVVNTMRGIQEARDRALDALLERGRITSTANVVTDTRPARPGEIIEHAADEPVIQI